MIQIFGETNTAKFYVNTVQQISSSNKIITIGTYTAQTAITVLLIQDIEVNTRFITPINTNLTRIADDNISIIRGCFGEWKEREEINDDWLINLRSADFERNKYLNFNEKSTI